MGFKTNPQEALLRIPACASAIRSVLYYPTDGGALIHDAPGQLFGMQWAGSPIMTPQQLCKAVFFMIMNQIEENHIKVYVLLKDINKYVPQQKKATHLARAAAVKDPPLNKLWQPVSDTDPRIPASNKPSYPDGTKLTLEGGLLEPDGMRYETFDMERVCKSRGMRSMVFDVIYKGLLQRAHLIPDDVHFIMDFIPGGPMLFHKGKVVQLTGMAHEFGEADLMVQMWLRYLRKCPSIVVASEDSDIVATMLLYLVNVDGDHSHKSLYLLRSTVRRADNMTEEKVMSMPYWDMLALHKVLTKAQIISFIALGLFVGTDYVQKDMVTPRLGGGKIFDYALTQQVEPFDISSLLVGQPSLWQPELASRQWCKSYSTQNDESKLKPSLTRTQAKAKLVAMRDELWKVIKTNDRIEKAKKKAEKDKENGIIISANKKPKKPTPIPRAPDIPDHDINQIAFQLHYYTCNWTMIKRDFYADLAMITFT